MSESFQSPGALLTSNKPMETDGKGNTVNRAHSKEKAGCTTLLDLPDDVLFIILHMAAENCRAVVHPAPFYAFTRTCRRVYAVYKEYKCDLDDLAGHSCYSSIQDHFKVLQGVDMVNRIKNGEINVSLKIIDELDEVPIPQVARLCVEMKKLRKEANVLDDLYERMGFGGDKGDNIWGLLKHYFRLIYDDVDFDVADKITDEVYARWGDEC